MNALHNLFTQLRKKNEVSWKLLEQDYLLSWVLFGIANVPKLKEKLIFKGGTALKKVYFGEYRFSQDLDFTVLGILPADDELEKLIKDACHNAVRFQSIYEYPFRIACERYREKRPHPHKQKAFTILAQFLWHRELHTRIMVEITTQEPVLLNPDERSIIHDDYNESIKQSIRVYRLEEIVAEKIRAILEFAKKLHERGWGRSRVRDYYDLWRIVKQYRNQIDISLIPGLVLKKCAVKKIDFPGPEVLFSRILTENLDDSWERWLGPFVPQLPNRGILLKELKGELGAIWHRHHHDPHTEIEYDR